MSITRLQQLCSTQDLFPFSLLELQNLSDGDLLLVYQHQNLRWSNELGYDPEEESIWRDNKAKITEALSTRGHIPRNDKGTRKKARQTAAKYAKRNNGKRTSQ